jgi:nitrogen-specific signal transduction histidine kinase
MTQHPAPHLPPDARILLDSMPNAGVLPRSGRLPRRRQPGRERFFGLSRTLLRASAGSANSCPQGSPLLALIAQVRQRGAGITEHDVEVVTNRC